VSTQSPLQSVVPPVQEAAQAPTEQTCEPGQAVPHAPQFAGAVRRFASHPFAADPSQLPQSAAQSAGTQLPAEQVEVAWASAQAFPQAPQLAASTWRSTQAAPHSIEPSGHGSLLEPHADWNNSPAISSMVLRFMAPSIPGN
jgi:hypothetical protein